MTPEQFIAKWRGSTRTERSAAQEHFLNLCALLEVPAPGDVDRHGTEYTFDKLTKRLGRGAGFADAWKKHCFAWEYKGPRKNLVEATPSSSNTPTTSRTRRSSSCRTCRKSASTRTGRTRSPRSM